MSINKRWRRADLSIPPIGCLLIVGAVLIVLVIAWAS